MATQVATLSGAETGLPDDALDALRTSLRGPVLTPADREYGGGRAESNAVHDGRPALVTSCSGTADVVDAVNFARDQRLAVAVRGGGHSVAGLSSIDGGMLIDLAPMAGVQVDRE